MRISTHQGQEQMEWPELASEEADALLGPLVITGRIVGLDVPGKGLVVKCGFLTRYAFLVDERTLILRGTERLPATSLELGARVTVEYAWRSGRRAARAVHLTEHLALEVWHPSLRRACQHEEDRA